MFLHITLFYLFNELFKKNIFPLELSYRPLMVCVSRSFIEPRVVPETFLIYNLNKVHFLCWNTRRLLWTLDAFETARRFVTKYTTLFKVKAFIHFGLSHNWPLVNYWTWKARSRRGLCPTVDWLIINEINWLHAATVAKTEYFLKCCLLVLILL